MTGLRRCCLLVIVTLLVFLTACASEFAARWQVEKNVVEDNGVTLQISVGAERWGLSVMYALYRQDDSAFLIPEDVVITDDTGKLRITGKVQPLDSFHGVNIGAIIFDRGPLYESNSLTLTVGQVRRVSQTFEEQDTLTGEWKLEGFMINILKGNKPGDYVLFQAVDPLESLGQVTFVRGESVRKPGASDYYVRRELRHASGDTKSLFYHVSNDGRQVQLAGLREYLTAEAEQ